MHLLLIEDDAAVASYVVQVVEMFFSIGVRIAASAGEARAIWEREKKSIAVILCDLVLPGESGEQLLRTLDTESRDVPVIFITGHLRDARQLSKSIQKPVSLLLKPFKPLELKDVISLALSRMPASAQVIG